MAQTQTQTQTNTNTKQHVVRDGNRRITFEGVLLGGSSSADGSKQRWSEIDIYRTTNGAYVVAGTGRSVRDGETDRHWANVIDGADGVVRCLTMRDADGVSYVPRVPNRAALEEAARVDSAIASSYGIC